MERQTFNQQLIEGLWNMRNDDRHPEMRRWLRQCIRLEKTRRSPKINGFDDLSRHNQDVSLYYSAIR